MAIGDMLRASSGFRRGQWTGRNPNSSPLFNQFSSQQQERPPGFTAKRAMDLGWEGYRPQASNSENSNAALAWLKQNHPSGLQRGMQAAGRGARSFAGQQLGGRLDVSVDPMPTSQTQTPLPPTSLQPPTNVSVGTGTVLAPGGPSNIMPRINLMGQPVGTGTVLARDDRPTEQPVQPTETQQAVTGTSPNMGMEQFRGRMGAAGFDLNAPTPPQTMIGGSGVPADVRKKIFRDEMDQRIRGKDLWTGMGIGESAGGQGPPSVERLTQEAEAPLSFWQKAGGFFKKPEVSRGMIAMGGSMLASDSPYFGQSLGKGIEAGQEAAGLAREEEERIRQEGRLDTQLAQQTEIFDRQLTAEDLSIKREEEKREAYENIFGAGKFDQAAFADAIKLATKHGDVTFAGQLINMYPKDIQPEYQIGTLYDSDEGYNVDYLYEISPDGTLDKTRIGRSEWKPTAAGGGQSHLNSQLGALGISAGMEMVKGDRPYNMAGWVRGPQGQWVKGGKLDKFKAYLGGVIGRGQGAEDAGWWNSLLDGVIRDGLEGSEFGESVLAGHVAAIEMINPVVRYLSGAQMTNKEAMRYYGSLVPTWGDPTDVVQQKIRYMNAMFAAMGGDQKALDALGATIDDFEEFAPDPTKSEAQNKADGIARGRRSQQILENAMATRELDDKWDNPSASAYMGGQVGSSLNIIR